MADAHDAALVERRVAARVNRDPSRVGQGDDKAIGRRSAEEERRVRGASGSDHWDFCCSVLGGEGCCGGVVDYCDWSNRRIGEESMTDRFDEGDG